jgi:hypothetical protein
MTNLFSWDSAKNRAIETKVRRAKQLAKTNPEFRRNNPQWAKEADKGIYTVLENEVIKRTKDAQRKAQIREEKQIVSE